MSGPKPLERVEIGPMTADAGHYRAEPAEIRKKSFQLCMFFCSSSLQKFYTRRDLRIGSSIASLSHGERKRGY
jgi:hypothetical protein